MRKSLQGKLYLESMKGLFADKIKKGKSRCAKNIKKLKFLLGKLFTWRYR